MKRLVSAVCGLLIMVVFISGMTSCAKGPAVKADATEEQAAETAALSVAPTAERAPITYPEAYDKFSAEYSRGHGQYVEYVENEADKLKDEVVRTNGEIKEILKERINHLMGETGRNDISYDVYYQSYVAPYDTYYAERMEAAEASRDAYYGLSTVVTFGGNSAGDCAALWRYVQYYNFLQELLELKDFLG